MYCDAEYGQSAPMHLLHGILLYGSENKIRLATIHQPVNDPQGGPPMLDAGEPLTRAFLEHLVRGLGSELPACFLPAHVLVYSASLVAWWEPAQRRPMFFASDCDGRSLDRRVYPHPPLVFAVRSRRLMVWALAENRRPERDSLLYLAPYWNVYADGGVCHGSMPAPETVSIENLSHWSHAFFASRFTGSNLGTQQCTHPEGFFGLWRSLAGKDAFPVEYLIRKGTVHELLCRNG